MVPRPAAAAPPRRALLGLLLAAAAAAAAADPSITLSPDTLSANGQDITVTWSGVTGVQQSDQIALIHSAPDASYGSKYPIKFVWVFQAARATYLTGAGTVNFHVVNHRQDLHFVYLRFQNDTDVSTAPPCAFCWGAASIVASAKLKITDSLKNGPHQLRISLLPNDKRIQYTVQVGWQSIAAGGKAGLATNRKALDKYIKDGKKAAAVRVADAKAMTYAPGDLCGSPANDTGYLDPGNANYAVYDKMTPGKTYFYAVMTRGGLWSDVRNFTVPPAASATKPVKILLAADVGTHNDGDGTWGADGQGFFAYNAFLSYAGSTTGPIVPGKGDITIHGPFGTKVQLPATNLFNAIYTVGDFPAGGLQPASFDVHKALNEKAASGQYHHAFIVGDIAYAEGMGPHWDFFLTQVEPLLSRVPTMYSNGNHESNGPGLPDSALPSQLEGSVPDGGGECGIVYERRLRMPFATGVDVAYRPEYYTYTVGPVAVVVLSTEQNWKKGSLQYNWLVKEFDRIAALRMKRQFPWLVVAYHRPMYVDDPDVSEGEGNQWVAEDLRLNLEPLFAKYQVDMTWTGHTHFYHRSCPAFKGGCAPGDAKKGILPPVHIMMGNGGFQPGASVFAQQPPWIQKEVFDYGYCEMEATTKELKMACLNAKTGAKFDNVTLSKKANWRPDPVAAEGYYNGVAPTPPMPGINLTADLMPTVQFLENNKSIASIATLLLLGQAPLMNETFGPGTPIDNLFSAPPGQFQYTMKEVSPVYLAFADVIWSALKGFAQFLPAIEEVDYILNVNSPPSPTNAAGGRLWQLLFK